MAKKYLTDIDLLTNELQNAVVQNLSGPPGSPVKGQIYFNTTDDSFQYYDGTVWQFLGDATTLVKGRIRLANDLGGTADNPTVPLLRYTNAMPTPVNIGGIPSGSTFSNETLDDIFTQLLYPYQYPGFTSFSMNGQSSTIEVGVTISGTKTFTWITSNSSNVNSGSVAITDGLTTIALNLGANGSTTDSIPTVQLTSPGSHDWSITGADTHNDSFSDSFTVSWLWRIFFGTSTNTSLTAVQIQALASNQLASSGLGSYSFASGGYKYICYPSSMAAASLFTDTQTGFDVTMADSTDDSSFSNQANGYYYALVSVTNGLGITTNYRVYRTKYQLGSSITIGVS